MGFDTSAGASSLSLIHFFQWCEASRVGAGIQSSTWLFPVIETFHLFALAMLGGAVLLVDLRLFGVGLRQPVAQIALVARPWLFSGLAVMIISGVLLFLSEAVKLYSSEAFWMKMTFLLLAIVFTFTVRRKVVFADEAQGPRLLNKLVAIVSVSLWLGVGIGGRWIGFS